MRVSVVGCGYLGAVHAAAMASLGHDVIGVDTDPARIAALSAGRAPFYEPDLDALLAAGQASGRLTFSTDIEAARGSAVHFIAVGTPQRSDALGADLRFVDAAFAAVGTVVGHGDLVVGKSTVPVGTAARLAPAVAAAGATLVWNPEFLREGFAVADTLRPDRLVYGVADDSDHAVASLDAVYADLLAAEVPRLVMGLATAELVKSAANSFLATKISFINAMAEICEVTGADVTELADAIGMDARIGRRFLNSGVGYGGGCLPKDTRAFVARAEELGVGSALDFLVDVDAINARRRDRVVDLARDAVGGDLTGRRVAVLGLAFKPDSDDIRDSPALDIALRLAAEGAHVTAADPEAARVVRERGLAITAVESADQALEGADVALLLTEWRQFRELDPVAAREQVAHPVMIDGRNVLAVAAWRAAGWQITALGRPTPA